MPIIQPLSGGSLDKEFNAALTKLLGTWAKMGFGLYANTLVDEIASIVVGDDTAKLQQGMLVDGTSYQLKESLGADTVYTENPAQMIAECTYGRVDLFGLEWLELVDSITKMATIQSIPSLAGKPAQMGLLEILKLIYSNSGVGPVIKYGTGTKNLFATDHLQDPKNPNGGTHGNLITQAKTTDGWNNVLQAIATRLDPGSNAAKGKGFMPRRNLSGTNLTIWTGHTRIATDLAKIFDPQVLWAVANGPESRRAFAPATIQFVPEMALYNSVVDVTNHALILVNDTPMRGVFARIPHAPRVDPLERIPSQHKSRVKGWQTWGQTGYWPFALYMWKFS